MALLSYVVLFMFIIPFSGADSVLQSEKKMQSVETFFVIVYRQNDRYLKYEYMQLFFLFFLREAIVGSPFILPVNRYEVGRGGPSHYHTLQVVSIAYF